MVPCRLTGEAGCEIKCKTSGAEDATCKFTEDLGAAPVTSYNAEGAVATEDDYAGSKFKGGSSQCEHEDGHPTSGICSAKGRCLKADTEEGAMGELNAKFRQRVDTFLSWVDEDTNGVPNYVWFMFGGGLLGAACCGMCYVGNHETHMCLGHYTGQGQNRVVPMSPAHQRIRTGGKRAPGYGAQQQQQIKHPARPY